MKMRDGDWHWYENCALNFLDDPAIEGILVSSRDITERQRQEQELERKNDQLAEFAGVVSHDIQTPLHVAQARLKAAGSECESQHIVEASDALDRLEAIVDATLEFTKQGQEVDEFEALSVVTVARDAWGDVATEEAELIVESTGTVKADEHRLYRLFENLVENAIKHGGTDVTVRVGVTDSKVYVADDGSGFEFENTARVFEHGISTTDDGLGLGLVIVRQIATAHGWTVSAMESTTGGARFEISDVTRTE
jgi:signal transduction histidine kinase